MSVQGIAAAATAAFLCTLRKTSAPDGAVTGRKWLRRLATFLLLSPVFFQTTLWSTLRNACSRRFTLCGILAVRVRIFFASVKESFDESSVVRTT